MSEPPYERIHLEACAQGKARYIDPKTGYLVFTSMALEDRGRCCGCGCRHCPYGHRSVPLGTTPPTPREPWIEGSMDGTPCDVLFWSGGKDSYLALRVMEAQGERPVVLLTTFEDSSEIVAHQNVTLEMIRTQVSTLGRPILFIPLTPGRDYCEQLRGGLSRLHLRRPIKRMAFGDLHLEHVRSWRVEALSPIVEALGAELHFPLWKVPYGALLKELRSSGVRCTLSAVECDIPNHGIEVGDVFDGDFVGRLPEGVDAFGENGEFHTYVEVLS